MPSVKDFCNLAGEALHQYLVKYQLIPAEGTYTCPSCHTGSMLLQRTGDVVDEWFWDCPATLAEQNKKPTPCGKQYAYKMGTFFERSPLPIDVTLEAVLYWVCNITLNSCARFLTTSEGTALDWSFLCREVLYHAMLQIRQPLGGPGISVEIDEAVFREHGHHQGQEVGGQRVLGGYERGTGRVFLVPVERDTETLVPLIMEWVLPGSIIISDILALAHKDCEYLTLHHAINFVDPASSVRINTTERRWRAIKRGDYVHPGQLRKPHVPGNLARYMFYKRCRELKLDRTYEFFRLAGCVYDPRHPREDTAYPGVLAACTSVREYVVDEDLDMFDNLSP